jgi:formylmethanofuran dehydrogenase subunit C
VSDAVNVVTLSLRAPLSEPLDVEGITADRVAGLSEREIAALPVRLGAREARLGDFFDVRGGRSARMRVEGALAQVNGLGAGMAGGELVIDGDAGRLVAAGMTGGEIIVMGSAGAEIAARARRGLVVVAGDAGADAARAMIAGTLVVFGRTGARSGRGSRRGSIVALGGIDVPVAYWCACTFDPPHVRLMLTYLRRRYGLKVDERMVSGRYRRYCGDAGNPGRGEILEWTGSAFSGDVAG